MTDIQFKSHLRMLLRLLNEAKDQETKEAVISKLQSVMDDLQASLED